MKTLTLKTHLNKVALLGALPIAPTVALTSSAQAAPARRAPVATRSNQVPTWNNANNQRTQAPRVQTPRFDSRFTPVKPARAPRYYASQGNQPRYSDHRDNDSRNNGKSNGNGKSDGNNTAKIIGAGIVGAILGAVLSR